MKLELSELHVPTSVRKEQGTITPSYENIKVSSHVIEATVPPRYEEEKIHYLYVVYWC